MWSKGHTKIDTWCAGCSCFMQGLNNFLICTMMCFSCQANWRVWCRTQLQMPGAAESCGPCALVARVALKGSTSASPVRSVTWVVTMLSYQGKEHAATLSEIPWLENKTSLLECLIQKYPQLRKCEHHAGHNHNRSAASFERKKSPLRETFARNAPKMAIQEQLTFWGMVSPTLQSTYCWWERGLGVIECIWQRDMQKAKNLLKPLIGIYF